MPTYRLQLLPFDRRVWGIWRLYRWAKTTELENWGPVTIYVRTEPCTAAATPHSCASTDRGHPAKPYDPIKVDKMTTPDEEITGYGGQAKTTPSQTTTPGQTNSPSGTNVGTGQSTGSGSTHSSGAGSSQTATSNSSSSAMGSSPSSSSSSTPSGGTATPAAEDMKAKARQAGEQVKAQGMAQLDSYRGTAADELEKVAQSAKAAAAELENQDRTGLSSYVSDMAQSMVELADGLRGKSVDELVGDVNRLARNNPGLFIAGSIAIGFGLTRFARASSHRAETSGAREPTTDYGHSDASRPHPSSPLGVPADVTAETLPSQAELDSRVSSGTPAGSVGSVSNAGMSSTTGSSTNGISNNGKGTPGGLNR